MNAFPSSRRLTITAPQNASLVVSTSGFDTHAGRGLKAKRDPSLRM